MTPTWTRNSVFSGAQRAFCCGRKVFIAVLVPGLFIGIPANGQTITRVSVDSKGVQANAKSSRPAMSADGRHVEFYSGKVTERLRWSAPARMDPATATRPGRQSPPMGASSLSRATRTTLFMMATARTTSLSMTATPTAWGRRAQAEAVRDIRSPHVAIRASPAVIGISASS